MSDISSISDLLSLSGSQYRVYDLGRRITKLSKEQFLKIEENKQPYPYPSQGHAFFAISFWQKKSEQTYIWFIKLPLDERGLLNQGARNHFIAIIIEALGSDLTVDANEKQEELLKSNPYNFTPAQYKLANLNSLISYSLKQKESIYYQEAQKYFQGTLGWNQWHNVGVQGINDIVVRIDKNNHKNLIINSLPHLPEKVLNPLCSALENQPLSAELIEHIVFEINSSKVSTKKQALIRSLASSCEHIYTKKYIHELIINDDLTAEIAIILAGRCWETLSDERILMIYLEKLVSLQDNDLFFSIFKDLVAIPTIRPIMFICMRSTNRTPALAQAIGKLFNT